MTLPGLGYKKIGLSIIREFCLKSRKKFQYVCCLHR